MARLEAIDYQDPKASEKFVASLRETGFGVIKNHPINRDLVQSIYDDWQVFFDSTEKNDYVYNKGPQDGFFPASLAESAKGQTVKDIKEYYHYYPWGKCPSELKPKLSQYYQEARSFAAILLDWVEKHSPANVSDGYSQSLSSMIEQSEQSLLRVLHYPPLAGDEEPNAIRAAAHEDINLLTVLPAASEPGLQVLSKSGDWLDVPCEFGYLIINIGDMLQEASGQYFPSTTHRVINPDGADMKKSRISLPLFLHPNPEVVLSDKYTAGSYLHERLTELGVI
ncbi:MAG: isopenicillin N synthase family oxygenase [Oceanospirillaceae bacterium]|nr:isopenicillin N synthase family oxygenase [Oceanospirillaceae bacterium]